MLIYAIDDEPNMLYLLHEAIAQAAPEAEIHDFSLGSEAIRYIETEGTSPDVVFSDIRMPGISGLELAARLKELSSRTSMVFVTGYDYAMDAYQLHVPGYIPKPVEAERIREELAYLFPMDQNNKDSVMERLSVQCFGTFEVFWQNQPLSFSRKKTKELLAFLVDRHGAFCSSDEIITALWEGEPHTGNMNHRLWNLTSDLRASLKSIGMEDVLISKSRQLAIRTERIDCDYYRMLAKDSSEEFSFRGEYMEQYSWAETTKGKLTFGRSDMITMK